MMDNNINREKIIEQCNQIYNNPLLSNVDSISIGCNGHVRLHYVGNPIPFRSGIIKEPYDKSGRIFIDREFINECLLDEYEDEDA